MTTITYDIVFVNFYLGLMKILGSVDGKGLLPKDSDPDAVCVLSGKDDDDYCQKAGNLFIAIWVRRVWRHQRGNQIP